MTYRFENGGPAPYCAPAVKPSHDEPVDMAREQRAGPNMLFWVVVGSVLFWTLLLAPGAVSRLIQWGGTIVGGWLA